MKIIKTLFRNFGFILFYPLVVVTIAGWFLIPYFKPFLKEVIAFGLFSAIVFCTYILISNTRIQKWFLIIASFLLSALAFIKLTFYYHYGVKLSGSALFVIFETNTEESKEFLSYYLDLPTLFIAGILFLPWIASLPFILKRKISPLLEERIKNRKWKFLLIFTIILAAFVIHKKFSENNIIYTSVASYSDYQATKAILKKTLAKPESEVLNVTSTLEIPQTYVVVIGESTSRWHMQLYGYERETNPLLTEIQDELVVFDDVITPNVHTILALDKILTLSDYKHPNKEENASVVQLANQAGFTTYWLSNQRPVGLHESMSTLIGNAADQKIFLATDDYNSNIYDENIFPKLESILNQKDAKKLIFIHLIGTHSDYKKRYPEQFAFFSGKPPQTDFSNATNEKIINEYDNAIRYNDFVVREIIETVRKENKPSYVVYFSDHGDEVYDTMDLMGHNEYFATPPMHEIPFIVWLSPEYEYQIPTFSELKSYSDRSYNLEDFIHSFSELSNIQFNLIDSTRSVFNQHFQKRTRWINRNKKQEDYDNR